MRRHRARGGAAGVQGTAVTPASQALGAVVHGCVLAQSPKRSSACLATRLHCEDGPRNQVRGRETRANGECGQCGGEWTSVLTRAQVTGEKGT